MTRQHDALYRAICAEPDEDTPRLVYADLIEEEGDGTRAAFIRDQVALARAKEYDPISVSARQLNPDAFHGWTMAHTFPKVPGGFSWKRFEFRRGFPWKVGVQSLGAFVDDGASIFEAAPIQALDVITHNGRDLAALADWSQLTRICRLEFSEGWSGADAITQLGNSPNANTLTELVFEEGGISSEGLEALALSDVFPRLEVLELRRNVISPALIVDALAAARKPGTLGRLSLAGNAITNADADHLFALPMIQGLQSLDLSDNNRLGVERTQALAASGALRGLRVLRLSNTSPGVPGVRALTEATGFSGVRSLDLSHNRLGPVAVKLIAESGATRGLRVLNLANNHVGDAGATAIANSRAFTNLLELDLSNADVTDSGAIALAESQYLGNLLRLNLATNTGRPFGSMAREALTERFGKRVTVTPS